MKLYNSDGGDKIVGCTSFITDLVILGGGSLPVTSTGMSSYLSKFIPAAIVRKILS